jgi:hypothetical protein
VRHLDGAAARVTDELYGDDARRTVGRLRAQLEFREAEEILDEGIAAFADRLSQRCLDVHVALGEQPFARGASLVTQPEQVPA